MAMCFFFITATLFTTAAGDYTVHSPMMSAPDPLATPALVPGESQAHHSYGGANSHIRYVPPLATTAGMVSGLVAGGGLPRSEGDFNVGLHATPPQGQLHTASPPPDDSCNTWTDIAPEPGACSLQPGNIQYTSVLANAQTIPISRKLAAANAAGVITAGTGATNPEFEVAKDDRIPISARGTCGIFQRPWKVHTFITNTPGNTPTHWAVPPYTKLPCHPLDTQCAV